MNNCIEFEEPKSLAVNIKNIKRISYQVISISLNNSANINVMFFSEEGVNFSWGFTLEGDDYKNWNDDTYLIEYINNMIDKMIA